MGSTRSVLFNQNQTAPRWQNTTLVTGRNTFEPWTIFTRIAPSISQLHTAHVQPLAVSPLVAWSVILHASSEYATHIYFSLSLRNPREAGRELRGHIGYQNSKSRTHAIIDKDLSSHVECNSVGHLHLDSRGWGERIVVNAIKRWVLRDEFKIFISHTFLNVQVYLFSRLSSTYLDRNPFDPSLRWRWKAFFFPAVVQVRITITPSVIFIRIIVMPAIIPIAIIPSITRLSIVVNETIPFNQSISATLSRIHLSRECKKVLALN